MTDQRREGPPSGDAAIGTSPVPSAAIPSQGDTILGKYEVEQVLGSGGMGVVLAVRHLQLGQRYAIKFVKSQAAADPTVVARFIREARAAVALSSEHVAKVFDVGTLENGAPFMLMEHLAGVDLGQVLDRSGPLGIAEAVGAVLQACEAIAEAHALGIVHRDLKPSNLFVSKRADGSRIIKVLDFGISKAVDTPVGQGLTQSGALMGSPGYMSPEQVRSPKTVDARTDVWALGVILFELLTGRAPFAADTLGETFAHILSDPPEPVRNLRPEVPEGLAAVIAQCLERDLGRRVQSIAALAPLLLPFAPREAELSVDRIRRIGGGARSESSTTGRSNTATFAAPSRGDGFGSGRNPASGSGRVPTASVWQTSSSTAPSFRRRSSRKVAIGAIAGVVVLGAVAGGVYALRGPQPGAVATISPPGPSAASANAPPKEVHEPAPEVVPPVPPLEPQVDPYAATELDAGKGSSPPRALSHYYAPAGADTPRPSSPAPHKKPTQPATTSTANNEKDIF